MGGKDFQITVSTGGHEHPLIGGGRGDIFNTIKNIVKYRGWFFISRTC